MFEIINVEFRTANFIYNILLFNSSLRVLKPLKPANVLLYEDKFLHFHFHEL